MCWKMHESTFHGHENILDFRFHGVHMSHDISTKFLAGYFHAWTMKSYKAMNTDFKGHESHIYFRLIHFMTPEK